jgi:hypothetical protein
MDEMQIDRDGVILDVEYDYEGPDHSVGYNGGVQIHTIKHEGVDIYDLLQTALLNQLPTKSARDFNHG